MTSVKSNPKKDVRLQVFVTEQMDDTLMDLAELMGMHKNDVVRVAIAQYVASWNQSVKMVKEYVDTNMLGQLSELGKTKQ